jgi:hypothetical protein
MGYDAFGCADGLEWLLISLELGGRAPLEQKPLARALVTGHKSDPKKTAFTRKVCNGTLTLRQAQKLEPAYKRTHG